MKGQRGFVTTVAGVMVGVTILALAIALTGCGAAVSSGDHITLTGTPEGMRAFADLSNGLIRTGKESAEQPSEFFAHRATQERESTARGAQGFWQKLVK